MKQYAWIVVFFILTAFFIAAKNESWDESKQCFSSQATALNRLINDSVVNNSEQFFVLPTDLEQYKRLRKMGVSGFIYNNCPTDGCWSISPYESINLNGSIITKKQGLFKKIIGFDDLNFVVVSNKKSFLINIKDLNESVFENILNGNCGHVFH